MKVIIKLNTAKLLYKKATNVLVTLVDLKSRLKINKDSSHYLDITYLTVSI